MTDALANLWSRLYPNLPVPYMEYRFHPHRRWRFDYAWPLGKNGKVQGIALEVEGGGWVKGRHHRAKGFEKDIKKYNSAVAMGWKLYRATWQMLEEDPSQVLELIVKDLKGGNR